MSGIKDTTVTMTRRQRDRMVSDVRRAKENEQREKDRANASERARKQAEQRSRQLTQRLAQADQQVSQIQQQTSQQLSAVRSQVDAVRQEQNRRLEQISRENADRLDAQSRDFQSRLRRQADSFNTRLENQRDELVGMVDDVKTDMREQEERLVSRMDQDRKQMEQSINQISSAVSQVNSRVTQVSNAVSQMEQTNQNHMELAQFWIREAESTFQEIEGYRHELFAPGKLGILRANLQNSSNFMQQQAYQTAIGQAANVFCDAMGLKEEVIDAEMEWNSWYSLLSQLYAETKGNLEDLDSMEFEYRVENEDGGEETVTVDADIDYWTGGKLARLKEQFHQIGQRFQDADNCTSSQLQAMIDELTGIQGAMNRLEADSRVSIRLSQERYTLACDIVEALSEGFAFEKDTSAGAYAQNGYRDSYGGTIKNPVTHDQVSFRISPGENEEGLLTNQMELHYYSNSNQEVLDGQMLEAITQAITGHGMQIGEMRCREGYEHRSSDQAQLLGVQA